MSRIRRNIMWLLLSQGATWIVAIVTTIFVPQLLGEQLFGELAFVAAYAAIFELVAIFGTGSYLVKSIARAPSLRGSLLYNALLLKIVTAVIVSAAAIVIGFALGFPRERMTLVIVFSVGIVLGTMINAVTAGLHGTQDMGRPAFWDVVRKYLAAALGIAVLLAGGGPTAYAIAGVCAAILPLGAMTLALRQDLAASGGLDLAVWRRLTIGGAPFFALAALNLLQGSIDVPMLESLAGTESVGWYTLALRWVSMPGMLAAVIATAFFPALSAQGATLNQAFSSMANRCLHFVALITIPAGVGIALIADQFIEFLYGSDFREAVPLMRLLSIEVPVAGINVVIGVAIVAADRQRQWLTVAAVAALFNPAANLVAIPWAVERFGNGAIGAALTTVITEMIMLTGAMRLRPSGVAGNELLRVIGRIVLAGAAMVPIYLLLADISWPVAIVAAAATYVGCALALRTVNFADLRELRGLLLRRRAKESSTEEESDAPL